MISEITITETVIFTNHNCYGYRYEKDVQFTGKVNYERKEYSLEDLIWDSSIFPPDENQFISNYVSKNISYLLGKLATAIKERQEDYNLESAI